MTLTFADLGSKFIIFVGAAFLVLAFLAAVREEFLRDRPARAVDDGAESATIEAATKFIRELRESPRWLALVAVGVVVIIFGSALETGVISRLLDPGPAEAFIEAAEAGGAADPLGAAFPPSVVEGAPAETTAPSEGEAGGEETVILPASP